MSKLGNVIIEKKQNPAIHQTGAKNDNGKKCATLSSFRHGYVLVLRLMELDLLLLKISKFYS